MRKEAIAGLLVLLMLAAAGGYMVINSDITESNDTDNSDETGEGNNLIGDEWDIYYVDSNSDLPDCDSVTQGRLYYVSSTSGFEACTFVGWTSVDLTGPEGLMGPAGVDGVDGADGINGTNGIDGSDGAGGQDGIDGQDGEGANLTYIASLEAHITELESQLSLRSYSQPPIPPPFGESVSNLGAASLGEKSIARDSTGRIHVVYRGVYNGTWIPMYTSGDGINWDTPMPIRTTLYSGVAFYYKPLLAIDSQDRLHVVFNDYGNIQASTEKVSAGFSYPGYGYTGYYARCDNCGLNGAKEWTEPFTGEIGGGLLPGTHEKYQYWFDISVDKLNDDVYIAWREDGVNRTTVVYKITSTGFIALPDLGDAYLHQNIIIDNDNRVLFVGGEYYNECAMTVYELWNDSNTQTQSWLLRDKLIPRIREGMSTDNSTSALGSNDGLLRHYTISTTVDKDNYVHILVEINDEWYNDKWRMMYYEFDPAEPNPQSYNSAYSQTGNREGKLSEVWVNPIKSPGSSTFDPSITVDDGINGSEPNVHIFWWDSGGETSVKYSSMERGGDEFRTPLNLFGTRRVTSSTPIITPEIAYVDGESNVVIDMLFILGDSDLRYSTLNLPLQYENDICQIGYFGECGGANLRGMDLSGMDLRGMDFRGADLSDVDFSGSLIDLVDFTLADIDGADFSNTYWMHTTWIDGVKYDSNQA